MPRPPMVVNLRYGDGEDERCMVTVLFLRRLLMALLLMACWYLVYMEYQVLVHNEQGQKATYSSYSSFNAGVSTYGNPGSANHWSSSPLLPERLASSDTEDASRD